MMQVLLSGLSIGAVYGLVAMAYAVVFYVTRVVNFATGQLLALALMVTAGFANSGIPDWFAIVSGLVASTAFGIIIYFVAVRPVLRFDRFSSAWLVSTLGVAIVLQTAAAIIWGPTSQSFPPLLHRVTLRVGDGSLSLHELLAIVVAVVALVGFEIFRRRTLFGKLGTAISSDPEMAATIGANVTAYAVAAFAIGGFLAGVAGIMIGPITYANPYLGNTYGIYGFVALMIGGIERPAAALVGGLVLGILSVGANTFIGSQAADWFPFLLVIVILLFAPHGLFASGAQLRRFFSRKREGITA